jgi:hypothetical protein
MKEILFQLDKVRQLRLIVPENLESSEVYRETYQRFLEIFNSMIGLDIEAMREQYIRQRN